MEGSNLSSLMQQINPLLQNHFNLLA